eukprot:3524453-Pleurochrysis_carterae.AAC.1
MAPAIYNLNKLDFFCSWSCLKEKQRQSGGGGGSAEGASSVTPTNVSSDSDDENISLSQRQQAQLGSREQTVGDFFARPVAVSKASSKSRPVAPSKPAES